MKDVISRGGDTDTNAAIVGGLIGSIIGFKKLPVEYKEIQLNLKLKPGPKVTDRSAFYEPKHALYNIITLFSKFIKK